MDVLIVDDHRGMRDEMTLLITAERDLEVVAYAEAGDEGLQKARALRPHIVLMDIALPGLNGIEASRAIHTEFPQTRILVVSNHAGRPLVQAAVKAGASGYVRKHRAHEELVPAIRAVAAGGNYFGEETWGERTP